MEKTNYHFLVWFVVVAVLVFAVGIWLRGLDVVAPGGGGAMGGTGSSGAGGASDSVLVVPLSSGGEIVADATAGYYFSMPTNWYVEKSAGPGLTVYPDYDPKSGVAPECKIELSVLAGSGGLNSWVTKQLHADPTADVNEVSRSAFNIGTSSAIEWHGGLNGVTTTLIYAAMPDERENGNILEMAPSALTGAGAASGDCDLALQALVANLQFGRYEK